MEASVHVLSVWRMRESGVRRRPFESELLDYE